MKNVINYLKNFKQKIKKKENMFPGARQQSYNESYRMFVDK